MKTPIAKSLAAAAIGTVLAFGVSQAQAAPTPVNGIMVGAQGETTFKFTNITN